MVTPLYPIVDSGNTVILNLQRIFSACCYNSIPHRDLRAWGPFDKTILVMEKPNHLLPE